MRTAVFVDLPNFYSRLVKSGIGEPRELRDYFLQWLDLDLLSKWLTGQTCPTWVFYSGRRIGPSSERIEGQHLEDFIKRTNRLPSVTAYDVNIPGDQREPFTTKCECGKTVTGLWESEKGVDASLIVHLFDTAESWEEAILLSGDADFTPAVRSLRRRGKIVSGAGFAAASESLIREFYRFENLAESLLKDDFAAFLLFGPGKLVDQWMSASVTVDELLPKVGTAEINCGWYADGGRGERGQFISGRRFLHREFNKVHFQLSHFKEENAHTELVKSYSKRFPELAVNRDTLLVNPLIWERVSRVLLSLFEKHQGSGDSDAGRIRIEFVVQNEQVKLKSKKV